MRAKGEPNERERELLDALRKSHSDLTAYRSRISWKFFQGRAEGAHEKGFDDSSWETRTLPTSWDPTQGDAWFRFSLVVPEGVSGISIEGSKAELVSSALICGAEVFVDSKLVLKEDYWTDFRGPRILVAERARPGDSHAVAIRAYAMIPVPKGERAAIPRIDLSYNAVDEIAFEIDSFCEEIEFAKVLTGGKELVRRAVETFDMDAFSRGPSAVLSEIEAARKTLAPLSKRAKQFKVHLIGHSHIDMNWLWPWEDTVRVIGRDFSTVLKLMEQYPDLHFSQSQVSTYRAAEENFPEVFRGIQEKVRSGNWDVTAAMWVEADLNMVGTEALVRQILYAKRYVKEKLGFEPKVCWEPDTFGHIWTLPQILRKSGLEYYYFMRCGRGSPMFRWQGPDGSSVLAFNSVYNNVVTPKNVTQVAREFYERFGLKSSMFVYGVGDHGGGPTIEDIKAAHLIQGKPTLPNAVLSSTHKFFEEVSRVRLKLPTVKDELNFTFDGCYTTHADIKRYNRLCERLLVDAEKFSSVASLHRREALLEAWRATLFNQFHDILDGSAVHAAYDYSAELAEDAIKTARGVLRESAEKLALEINVSGDGLPIVVFNQLSWDRKDVVVVRVPRRRMPNRPVVVNSKGNSSPAQTIGDEVVFVAEVPSLGYATYYLREGGESDGTLVTGDLVLENETLRVEIDKDSGAIRSLHDKRAKRDAIKERRDEHTMLVPSNVLHVLYEIPHGMSAWIIGKISRVESLIRGARVDVVEKGPVRAKVRAMHSFSKSKIVQDTILYKGISRVDFHVSLDWQEVGSLEVDSPMLKVSFTPSLGDSVATFEIPFGHVVRPADGREYPALRWVDLSDKEYGLSLLNDSKYGFDVNGNTLRMTLVRSSYNPDPIPDQGHHEIGYSIYPHEGDWRKALTFRRGYEFNHPLEPVVLEAPSQNGSRPETHSFIRVSPDEVVVSCVKIGEDSDDLIVRVYDAGGGGALTRIQFGLPVVAAFETDLIERATSRLRTRKDSVTIRLRPFDIRTLRVRVRQPGGRG